MSYLALANAYAMQNDVQQAEDLIFQGRRLGGALDSLWKWSMHGSSWMVWGGFWWVFSEFSVRIIKVICKLAKVRFCHQFCYSSFCCFNSACVGSSRPLGVPQSRWPLSRSWTGILRVSALRVCEEAWKSQHQSWKDLPRTGGCRHSPHKSDGAVLANGHGHATGRKTLSRLGAGSFAGCGRKGATSRNWPFVLLRLDWTPCLKTRFPRPLSTNLGYISPLCLT